MGERRARSPEELSALRHAAVVFPPRHLTGVGVQVLARDVVVDTHFGAADAAEEAFGPIRASLVGRIGFAVVDALGQELPMQRVPR